MKKKLVWDKTGERLYETGVSQGVLYPIQTGGVYNSGTAWNGLSTVTESPSGAEPSAIHADNIKYLNLMSAEEFGGTIEAYMAPDEFAECDGSKEIAPGVFAGQQNRKMFGLSYKTLLGNDVDSNDYGYKLHLVYGCLASPSEKGYSTVNDSPEAITLSWEFSLLLFSPSILPRSMLRNWLRLKRSCMVKILLLPKQMTALNRDFRFRMKSLRL